MKKLFFLIVAFFAFGLFAADHAYALKVDPTLISVTLNPGESKNAIVKLTNESATPVDVQQKMYSATAGDNEKGFPLYAPVKEDDTLARWVTFANPEKISLGSNETKDVDVTISLPANAAPGGHYAAIGWNEYAKTPTKITAENGATVLSQVMTNIALDVPGVVFEKGTISSFSTLDKGKKYERLPIDFSVRVANSGNRHFKPSGNVVIKNMIGSTVAVLPVNEGIGGGNVLPQSTREFKVTWKEGFAFGRYTATANLSLGTAGAATESYSFWVLPTLLLVIWGVGMLILIAIIVMAVMIMRGKKKQSV